MKFHFSILVWTLVLATDTVDASIRCSEIFSRRTSTTVSTKQQTEVRDLMTFGQAMTEGMLLRPEQGDLFEIYRKIFFGDPNTSVNGSTLKTVTDTLKQHPEITKPHFREYEIETVQKVYETPDSLAKYLRSQNINAGQIRSNLFQVEANLGFWKKMVGYEDPFQPENLSKEARKRFQEQLKVRFMRYLDRIISEENRELLKNEKTDYRLKTKTLFSILKRMSDHMDKRGQGNRSLRQAMVDLVATTGFNNQATQALLKSKNALERIEGLKKISDERDSMAMELGYAGHFDELLEELKIESPTLSSKSPDEVKILSDLERDIFNSPFQTLPSEKIRVRSLSIQEAPFRSCLGGSDCASRTYFSKAFDPNFNYFTMTDSENHSTGHATVVLGTAKDQVGLEYKVAFVDKLQNVPNQTIMSFLEAVRRSLFEKGYSLVIPDDVGDCNGLSNRDTTRHFVASEILPLLSNRLTDFTPSPHQYNFKNKNSRAYKRLPVKVFEFKDQNNDVEIRPAQSYEPRLADAGLNKQKLVQDLINLRDSSEEQDIQKYVSSGQIISQLEKLGLFSEKEFLQDLIKISGNEHHPLSIRKQAFFEILLFGGKDASQSLPYFKIAKFSDVEKVQVTSEINQWSKSSERRKRQFADGINDKWFESARTGNESLSSQLLALRLVDINQRNQMGYTALTMAVQNRQTKMVEKLLSDSKINVLEPDNKRFTALDHALALGHEDFVRLIKERRPDVRWSANKWNTARVHQTIDFVRVGAGSYQMGDSKVSRTMVPVTITQPVDIMSTLFTQKMYLKFMEKNPAWFKEGKNTVVMKVGKQFQRLQPDNPIEMISYEESSQLVDRINELSKQDSPLLYELIPDHKKGDRYDFITDAQLEYVMKKAKTEDGDTIDEMLKRNDMEKLKQYAVYHDNSGNTTHPVGTKKPLFVDGKPIHDLNGNVWVWVKDAYRENLPGGTDPVVMGYEGSYRVIRGGCWYNDAQYLRSAGRLSDGPGYRYDGVGFRLVRTPR